jgi:hypothetical protein
MIEKRMHEYRRLLNDFEVVDCVDPEQIEKIRGHLKIDAPLTVTWQWEYGSEIAELRALYEKGKRNQWNAATDLDWDVPVTSDEWIIRPEASQLATACRLAGRDETTCRQAAFDEVAYVLSQLLHGEQAALQLCGQLTNLCTKTDEKWYAASQVADEARHSEVFARFVGEKMGTVYPIGATVKSLLDELLSVEGYEMKTLGMQTLFEGMAVGIMDLLRNESRNPLFSEMLRRVQQDESRHAAFGVLTVRRVVRDCDEAQRERMEDWAFGLLETLNANQQLDMLRLLCPKYDLDPVNVALLPRMAPNWAELNSIAFMHTVVPNLVRLGLITERTEPEWRRLGIMTDTRGHIRSSLVAIS